MGQKQTERKDARRDGKFYNSLINSRIRERLQEKDWTAVQLQKALAEKKLKLTAEAVRQWVSGYSQPKVDNIPLVAEVLGCSVNYLFGGTNILQISAQKKTLAELDFPQEAIEQLSRRCKLSRLVAQDRQVDDDLLRVHSSYTLFLHIIGKPDFWAVLDGLSDYIESEASSWGDATITTPSGDAKLDGKYIRDAIWASCIDPLRKIVDNTMFVSFDGGTEDAKENLK